jgi:hypothetical protein
MDYFCVKKILFNVFGSSNSHFFLFFLNKTLPTKPHVHACPIDGFVMVKGSNIGTKP